jgi:DNA-binding NtrC family response regulator
LDLRRCQPESLLVDASFDDFPVLGSAPPASTLAVTAATELPALTAQGLPAEGLELYLQHIEKQIILKALEQSHWNRTAAARKLGMSFRSLRYRLKKLGLGEEEDLADEGVLDDHND